MAVLSPKLQTVNLIIVHSPHRILATSTGVSPKPILPCPPPGGDTGVGEMAESKSPAAVLKNSPEASDSPLRCKRRLDFARLGLHRPHPGQITRRNERERNRVKHINNSFLKLQQHLPSLPGATPSANKKIKKLSKVDTLRGAIQYIEQLQRLLHEHDTLMAGYNSHHQMSSHDALMTGYNQQMAPLICPPLSPGGASLRYGHYTIYIIISILN